MNAGQPRLFEFRMGERSPETLIVSQANEAAVRLLKTWPTWPGGALALIGPKGSGKTHLALAWALEAGARAVRADAPPEEAAALFHEAEGRVWVDDADGARNEAGLWRLLDLARAKGGAALIVGTRPPAQWGAEIPDLRSRLQALPVAQLGEPDEMMMEAVLRRVCREQFIELSEDGARYLARRMPRTFAAVHAVAAALDENVRKAARPVSAAAAKRALQLAAERGAWSAEESDVP